jgi:hypothetical protein
MNGVWECSNNRPMKAISLFYPGVQNKPAYFPPDVTREDSSFANNLRWPLVVAHADKGAVPQMSGVCPFDVGDLANQLRFDPTALLHFLSG